MESNIEVRRDRNGDTFIPLYSEYVSSTFAADHLNQLSKNYERCFGELPDRQQLDAAVQFIGLFFAEIGECYPRTKYAANCSSLSWIIDDSALKTAENISSIKNV